MALWSPQWRRCAAAVLGYNIDHSVSVFVNTVGYSTARITIALR